MSKSPWNLDEVEKRLQQTKEVLPAEIANVSQSYFESSWRKQGYDGKKWKEVQRRINGKGAAKTRAILVKSGRLRRSFHVLSKRWDNITIANSAPYAKVHNEGGVIHKNGHRGVMYYREVSTNLKTKNTSKRFAKTKGKKNKATHAMEINIPAHDISIPQRQFMGQTNELGQKQIRIINKAFDDIWR